MKTSTKKFYVVKGLASPNTYFIFRDYVPYEEVRVEIKNNTIRKSKFDRLLPEETNYLIDNYFNTAII